MNDLKVEIFATGLWNGMTFTLEDLKSIANAFHTIGNNHQVPLKMGHNEDQPFTDGQPALGWVKNVFVEDEKLVAEFSDVPEIVMGAFKSKLYKNVSVELDMGVEYKSSYYPLVLSGVALLGADIPAVNTLADLQAYMGRDELKFEKRVAFTANFNKDKEDKNMSDSEDMKALKIQMSALQTKLDAVVTENVELKTERVTKKAEFAALEKNEELRKVSEQKTLLTTQLDQMVKDKKIAPFTRDELLADYDNTEDKSVVMFAVDKLEKTINANPAYFGAEQARKVADQKKNEDGKDASAIVVQRTNEYMAKHGEKNFSTAKTMVLRADSELAERYTKMEG